MEKQKVFRVIIIRENGTFTGMTHQEALDYLLEKRVAELGMPVGKINKMLDVVTVPKDLLDDMADYMCDLIAKTAWMENTTEKNNRERADMKRVMSEIERLRI